MRTETYSTPGHVRLNLEIPSGRIEIEPTSDEETHVRLEALSTNDLVRELIETARIELVRRGDRSEVVVEARIRHGFWVSFGRDPDILLRVTCPPGADLDIRTKSADLDARGEYGSVEVKTASGDVNVEQASGDIRVKTASGDVHVAKADARVEASSASGDVQLGTVRGEVNVQLVSGDLHIREADDSVTANTVSGDQRLEAVLKGRMELRAISGDISVGVRRGSRVFVDANTVSGSTSSELELSDAPQESPSADTDLVELFVKTVSGDVRIDRAPAPAPTTEVSGR